MTEKNIFFDRIIFFPFFIDLWIFFSLSLTLLAMCMPSRVRVNILFLLINYLRNEIVEWGRLKKLKTRGVNLLVHNFFSSSRFFSSSLSRILNILHKKNNIFPLMMTKMLIKYYWDISHIWYLKIFAQLSWW